jgi:hypothetical protein
MEPPMFITVFTTACHWSLSRPSWIQSTPLKHIPLVFILILFFYLHLVLTSGLFSSGFRTKILQYLLSPPCVLYLPPILSSFNHPTNIWLRIQIIKLQIMSFSWFFCYFISLRSKHSPQEEHFNQIIRVLVFGPSLIDFNIMHRLCNQR